MIGWGQLDLDQLGKIGWGQLDLDKLSKIGHKGATRFAVIGENWSEETILHGSVE